MDNRQQTTKGSSDFDNESKNRDRKGYSKRRVKSESDEVARPNGNWVGQPFLRGSQIEYKNNRSQERTVHRKKPEQPAVPFLKVETTGAVEREERQRVERSQSHYLNLHGWMILYA